MDAQREEKGVVPVHVCSHRCRVHGRVQELSLGTENWKVNMKESKIKEKEDNLVHKNIRR